MILLLIFLVLFPLGVYCLALSSINRREHPLLISGMWDLVGLLCALSGVLVVAGPAILSSLSDQWRVFWLIGPARMTVPDSGGLWRLLFALYFVAVIGGAALLLYSRRGFTAIYNVDEDAFNDVLKQSLEWLGVSWTRTGNRVFLAWNQPADVARGVEQQYDPKMLSPDQRNGILVIESFAAMSHLTLRWEPADSLLRQTVEAELARSLGRVTTVGNTASFWFLTVAAAIFGILFLILLVAFVFLILVF